MPGPCTMIVPMCPTFPTSPTFLTGGPAQDPAHRPTPGPGKRGLPPQPPRPFPLPLQDQFPIRLPCSPCSD